LDLDLSNVNRTKKERRNERSLFFTKKKKMSAARYATMKTLAESREGLGDHENNYDVTKV
jgi:hypothetical protein